MELRNCWKLLLAATSGLLFTSPGLAQTPALMVKAPVGVVVKKGATVDVKVTATLNEGFHLNSHTPTEDYLIPLTLKWEGPLEAVDVVYPKPTMEKYAFDDKPLSVLTGQFVLATKFKAAAGATPGPATLNGKIRYQACNNNSCFPPKTVPVTLTVQVLP
jgi:thiol:disulfide interchange protein DsbD